MPYVTASAPLNDSLLARHPAAAAAAAVPSASAGHRWAAAAAPVGAGRFTIHLRPLFDRAALDVIRHYRWRNISYVYDSNDGQSAASSQLDKHCCQYLVLRAYCTFYRNVTNRINVGRWPADICHFPDLILPPQPKHKLYI